MYLSESCYVLMAWMLASALSQYELDSDQERLQVYRLKLSGIPVVPRPSGFIRPTKFMRPTTTKRPFRLRPSTPQPVPFQPVTTTSRPILVQGLPRPPAELAFPPADQPIVMNQVPFDGGPPILNQPFVMQTSNLFGNPTSASGSPERPQPSTGQVIPPPDQGITTNEIPFGSAMPSTNPYISMQISNLDGNPSSVSGNPFSTGEPMKPQLSEEIPIQTYEPQPESQVPPQETHNEISGALTICQPSMDSSGPYLPSGCPPSPVTPNPPTTTQPPLPLLPQSPLVIPVIRPPSFGAARPTKPTKRPTRPPPTPTEPIKDPMAQPPFDNSPHVPPKPPPIPVTSTSSLAVNPAPPSNKPQRPLPPSRPLVQKPPSFQQPFQLSTTEKPSLIYNESTMTDDGNYTFDFKVTNSVYRREQGFLKKSLEPPGLLIPVKSGAYSFTSPEGTFHRVDFVADENGYRAFLSSS